MEKEKAAPELVEREKEKNRRREEHEMNRLAGELKKAGKDIRGMALDGSVMARDQKRAREEELKKVKDARREEEKIKEVGKEPGELNITKTE